MNDSYTYSYVNIPNKGYQFIRSKDASENEELRNMMLNQARLLTKEKLKTQELKILKDNKTLVIVCGIFKSEKMDDSGRYGLVYLMSFLFPKFLINAQNYTETVQKSCVAAASKKIFYTLDYISELNNKNSESSTFQKLIQNKVLLLDRDLSILVNKFPINKNENDTEQQDSNFSSIDEVKIQIIALEKYLKSNNIIFSKIIEKLNFILLTLNALLFIVLVILIFVFLELVMT